MPRSEDPAIDQVVDEDVHIRPASRHDLAALVELDATVFGELAYPYFVLRQLFDLYPGWWLVAEHPDGLRGYSLGVPTFGRGHGWLLGLGVMRDFRRRGYGRSLADTSMRLLADVGVQEVCLTVEPANRQAIKLYRELGFVAKRLGRDYFGPGQDRLVMAAQLRDRDRSPAGPERAARRGSGGSPSRAES